MLRLWGRANSSNVMKVIWLLEELRVPYQRLDVGGQFGQTDTPEYRAMNPNGLVPTIEEEDGFTLWESNAILRYLCARHAPDSPLWPRELRARANVDRWMDYQQTALNAPQGVVFLGLVRTPPEGRDMAGIMRAAEQLGRIWSILDAELARHPYIAGAHLTLADMAFGPHIHRWFSFSIARPDTPHLRAWYERLLALPIYAQHLAVVPS
jgi:glutathione S-transferase